MQVSVDKSKFDKLQLHLIREIITSIKSGLQEAGIDDEQVLYETTGNMAFGIAAIIDGSQVMELDGEDVAPILTFAKERFGDELISSGMCSWMHEYVFGMVDDVFDEAGEDEEEDD